MAFVYSGNCIYCYAIKGGNLSIFKQFIIAHGNGFQSESRNIAICYHTYSTVSHFSD